MNAIIYASTTELAAAIRAKNVSAVEALAAHLDQIEKHNPTLNAVVTLDVEGAKARAREADDALAHGENWGSLHGVPFTMKDAFATKGMRSTIGFPPFDFVPQTDSTVAARLKAAGGILAGKTNVPTLLADYQTNNPIFGRTNNPWDTSRTPGGSSGGAAAAVASGMTPFEIGTDLSGSVRIPAHFCGVYGLKPTEHRVPLTGAVPEPFDSPRPVRVMSTIGMLARTVDDLALLYQIIAGPDGQDTDVPPMPLGDSREIPLAGLRIAVAPTFPGVPVSQEISDAVTRLAHELAPLGVTVEEPPLPDVDFEQDLQRAGDLIAIMTGAFQSSDEPPTPLAQYLKALHLRDQSIAAWDSFFEEWDALLCPPAMITAFPHCDPGSTLKVDDQETSYWMVSAHTTIFNYTGHPAIVLPSGFDRSNLPIGVQLVGKRWDESRLLAMASAIAPTTAASGSLLAAKCTFVRRRRDIVGHHKKGRDHRMTSRSFSKSRLDRMHSNMNGYVKRGDVPGIVTLVARHGEVHFDAIGTLGRSGNKPMQRDTIFRIASMTKPITAVAAMILVEECIVRLDDPVDDILPELANRQVLTRLDAEIDDTVPANRPITLRDLLSFTSGYGIVMAEPETYPIQRAMTAVGIIDGPPHPQEVPAPDAWLSRLAGFPLLSQPGARWHYNTAADILGILIARAAGKSFASFLQERIFAPLGMVDTGFSVPPGKIDRLATSYETNSESGTLDVFDEAVGGQWSSPPPFESGAGGLVSAADDVLRFSRLLLAKGACHNGHERILSRAAVETMLTDHLTPAQKVASVPDTDIFGLDGWGFGAAVTTRRTSLSATPGQFGWAGGLGTSWAIDPKEDLAGIYLSQVALSSPSGSAAMNDFWTTTYAAIDD